MINVLSGHSFRREKCSENQRFWGKHFSCLQLDKCNCRLCRGGNCTDIEYVTVPGVLRQQNNPAADSAAAEHGTAGRRTTRPVFEPDPAEAFQCAERSGSCSGGFKPSSEAALITPSAERAQQNVFDLQSACFRFVRFLHVHFCRRVVCKGKI